MDKGLSKKVRLENLPPLPIGDDERGRGVKSTLFHMYLSAGQPLISSFHRFIKEFFNVRPSITYKIFYGILMLFSAGFEGDIIWKKRSVCFSCIIYC